MGELNGLRSDCVDLKRSRIFVNRSLTVLKGGLVLEHPKHKTRLLLYWITAAAELAKSEEKAIPEAYDQWVPNFMRSSHLGVHHTIVRRRPVVSGKGELYGHDRAMGGVVESVFRFASR